MTDQRLSDDADALSDLRAAAPSESLVEQVLVEALAVLAPVLLGPGDPEPAPLAELGHELTALRGVDDLGHVLAGEVEDLGVLVLVEEGLDLLQERDLLRGKVEIHVPRWTSRGRTPRI